MRKLAQTQTDRSAMYMVWNPLCTWTLASFVIFVSKLTNAMSVSSRQFSAVCVPRNAIISVVLSKAEFFVRPTMAYPSVPAIYIHC